MADGRWHKIGACAIHGLLSQLIKYTIIETVSGFSRTEAYFLKTANIRLHCIVKQNGSLPQQRTQRYRI